MSEKANMLFYHKNVYESMLEGYAMFAVLVDEHHQPYDYRFLEVNRQFEVMAGVQRSEIIGQTLKQAFDRLGKNGLELCDNLHKIGDTGSFEFFLGKGGRYFQVRAFHLSSEIIVTVFLDVTAQNRAKVALEIHKALFEGAHDIILYMNTDGQVVDSNQRACETYGYTKEQLLTKKIQEIRHPSTLAEYEAQMQQAEMGGVVFESLHMRSDGSSFPTEVSSRVVHTEKGPLRIHIIRDITDRKAQEAKIAWLAKHDALTGIQNRGSLMMQLEQEIQRAKRSQAQFAVMLFDIDKFKSINDQYGHEAGDVVLRHVAAKVRDAIRTTDQIFRLGGDEFVVLQTDVKERSDVERLAQRIQAATAEAVTYGATSLHVNISIGISLFPTDATDIDTLLLCADRAMYIAKNSGGDRLSFFLRNAPPVEGGPD